MSKLNNIAILTGAGISAESGLETFRGSDGTWNKYQIEDVATPEGFARNPDLVNSFYNERRKDAAKVVPNAAHIALAKLEKHWCGDFLLITQNVDNLHERAGSKKLVHMHGTLNHVICLACQEISFWCDDITSDSVCPNCSQIGHLRPDIVWFGEMPYYINEIEQALHKADIFISIGTSGTVYPAAGFVSLAHAAGAKCFELNLTCNTASSGIFDYAINGPASITVPEFVDKLILGEL